jgi:glycosyltransferase involved in cell wall biosynthesis
MMAAIDVFLLTSLWEGLPRVIPQSMAMGIPVVANRADGTVEAIQDGETGYLCEPGDLDQMAKYCVMLLNDKDLQVEMGLKGQVFARCEFSLTRMISQIEALYEDLLTKKQSQK